MKRLSLIGAAGFLACGHSLAGGTSDWQRVACVPAELPAEALYKTASSVDDFERDAASWGASKGSQNAAAVLSRDTSERHGGAASLRVAYTFVGKKDFEYLEIQNHTAVPKAGLGFGFWMKSDGTPFTLRLRFADAGNEIHQIDLRQGEQKPGWRFVAAPFDSRSTAWGGDKNQRKDYPCRLVGIVIDRPSQGFTGQGSLWIDDAALLERRPTAPRSLSVLCRDARFGNLFRVGERVALRASGKGERIRWLVSDYQGNGLAAGQGSAGETAASFTLDRAGYYSCAFELLSGDTVEESASFDCAALPGGRVEPSDFLGMCTHYGHRSYPLETMELLRRYGISRFRDEISWRDSEKAKGSFAMTQSGAEFLQKARELKMRPLLIFDYSNPNYDGDGFPNSPEAITAFSTYAVKLAGATRGVVSDFEVWNEWCGGCGMKGRSGVHDGAAYGKLLAPAYKAVKGAYPDVTVVGMGGEYGKHCVSNLLAAVGTAGPGAMDAWSIHPYRYPRTPESSDLTGEVNRIADEMGEAGVKVPMWITEIGYPTHTTSGGSSLAQQARHTVRTVVLLQQQPRVGKLFWYDFKDDGLDRTYNENNFGVVRHQQLNCAPKPAAAALAAWVRLTGRAKPAGLSETNGLYVASYRAGRQDILVAWTASGSRTARVGGQLTEAADLMGEPFAVAGALRLSEAPVYLTGRNLSLRAD